MKEEVGGRREEGEGGALLTKEEVEGRR